jgi:hypothetical protein
LGFVIIKKTEKIISDWNVLLDKQRDLFRDDHNEYSNYDGFVENRHDQSALSILLKQSDLMIMVIDNQGTKDKILEGFWAKDVPLAPVYNFMKNHLDYRVFNAILRTYHYFKKRK